MGVIKEVEPDSSWWCAVKGKQALFAAGGNPTSYKGKKEKKKKKVFTARAVRSCGISIAGDVQGLAQPI